MRSGSAFRIFLSEAPFGAITQDHEEEYVPGSQTCERFGGILFFP